MIIYLNQLYILRDHVFYVAESFISMKFEDDGKALWDKSAAVVEHRHGVRWRKRVENLLQVYHYHHNEHVTGKLELSIIKFFILLYINRVYNGIGTKRRDRAMPRWKWRMERR